MHLNPNEKNIVQTEKPQLSIDISLNEIFNQIKA